jgi:SAM-dependent methyltransferase
MTTLETYPLGYSEAEAKRLVEQGAMLEDLTGDFLSRAGLAEGMRVLDVGCGVGDVSLLAGRMVGKKGAVLGGDRSGSSLEIAGRRAARRAGVCGMADISFIEADLMTAYDFSAFQTLGDLGGSTGNLLTTILSRHKGPRGTLFDLPHVVRDAPSLIQQRGLGDRIEMKGGDFFVDVPAGAELRIVRPLASADDVMG